MTRIPSLTALLLGAAASFTFGCEGASTAAVSSNSLAACVSLDRLNSTLGSYFDSWASVINDRREVAGVYWKPVEPGQTELYPATFFVSGTQVTNVEVYPTRIFDINNAGMLLLRIGGGNVVWHAGTIRWVGERASVYAPRETTMLNDQGEVVGMTWGYVAFLERPDGELIELGVAPGYTRSTGLVINNASQVAGTLTDTASGKTRPFFWHDGVMTELTGFDARAEVVQPTGMNEAGAVVGWSLSTIVRPPQPGSEHCEPTLKQYRGFLWQDGALTDLGPDLVPTDINERNEISGYTFDASDQRTQRGDRPFYWANGELTLIQVAGYPQIAPVLDGDLPESPSRVFINDVGQVLGTVYNPSTSTSRAFAWQAGELIDLSVPNATATVIRDVNNAGQAAGFVASYPGYTVTEAAVWDLSGCASH